MQHSSLVVLGLLAERPQHGYELEQRIRRQNIRLWARIGASTIYKCLGDLEKAGFLTSRPEAAERGVGRSVFAITDLGRLRLDELVASALRSEASTHSDRIVGMAFAHRLERAAARDRLEGAQKGLAGGLAGLEQAQAMASDPISQIIIDYYLDVVGAERKALARAASLLGSNLSAGTSS